MESYNDRNKGEAMGKDGFADTLLPEETMKTIIKEIETKLRTRYLEINLPYVHWLGAKQISIEDINIYMKMHVRNRFGAEEDNGPAQIPDIFKEVNGKLPRRVLIEGQTGYGKTTLALKLVHDWAKNCEYITSKYRLVFLVSLRNAQNDLEGFLVQESNVDNYSSIEVLQAIGYFQENILLILDGFDEISEQSKREIMLLLKRDKYPHMSVMVTTTPALFQVEIEKVSPRSQRKRRFLSMRSATAERLPFWTKRIELLGILQENRGLFLWKYFGTRSDILKLKLNSILQTDARFLCECPLMYLLLAVACEDQGFQSVTTKTELFKTIINFLLRKNFIDEKSITADRNIDIFQLPRENLLYKFGELALKKIKEGKYFFSENEILEHCQQDKKFLEVGFLFKCLKLPLKSNIEYYQIVHPVFLDFFAAFHLANFDIGHSNALEGLKSDVTLMVEKGFDRDKDCFVFSFLTGLLGAKANYLFKIMSSWGALYRADAFPLANIVTETTLSDEILDSLSPLIPPKWEIDTWNLNRPFFLSASHCALVRHGIRNKLIHILEWNPIYECNFPEMLQVDRLELRIAEGFHSSFDNLLKKKIICEDLVCHFIKFQEKHWEKIGSLLSTAQFQRLTIGVWTVKNEHFPLQFCTEMTDGRLKNVNLHRLGIYGLNPHKDRKIVTFVESLLEKQRIKEGVWIEIWKDKNLWNRFCGLFTSRIRSDDLKSFFTHCSKSTLEEMICIALSVQNTSLDVNLFCNEGKRPWKYLYTDGDIQIKLDKISQGYLPIEELKICWWKDSNLMTAVDFLSLCHQIKRIACRSEFVKHIAKAIPQDWPGYQTTEEVNIKLLKDSVHPEQMDSLANFRNLQKLSLDLGSLGDASLPASIASTLIFVLPSLPLRILEVLRIKEVNIPFLERILGGIVYSDEKKETQLLWEKYDPFRMGEGSREIFRRNNDKDRIAIETIKMGFHAEVTIKELKYCFSFIFQLLSNKQVEKFSIIDINMDTEEDIISHFFAFRENFRIQREIEGLEENDSLRTRRKLNYMALIRDKISITKRR